MSKVEHFIESQEGPVRDLFLYLHELLMSYPEVESKIRYRIPFYFRHSWIVYLNPQKNGSVEMCFLRGNELSNEQGLLDFKDRKQVAGIELKSIKDIPLNELHELIQEAMILDETIPYESKRKKK